MKFIGTLFFVIVIIISFNCGSSYSSLQDLRYEIKGDTIEVFNVDSLNTIPPLDSVGVLVFPKPIHSIKAVWPLEAMDQGLQGTVWVKMWITKNGEVKKATILKSSNNIFNRSALLASIQWRFTSGIAKNGDKMDIWLGIPFTFRLK